MASKKDPIAEIMNLKEKLAEFNRFCKNLHEGDILYNINSTNLWGEYLLVAAKATVRFVGQKSYFIFLLGLKKCGNTFTSNNVRINFSFDKMGNLPFLKPVGFCRYSITPSFGDTAINNGLVVMYSNVDLQKYTRKHHLKKSKRRKYDVNGEKVIQQLNETE